MAGKSPEEAQFYWTGGPIEVAPKTWFASLFSGCVAFDTTDGLVRVRQLDSPKEPCQRWCPPLGGACTTLCEPLSGRAALRDVLTAKPTTERPAIAEVSVPLTAAHCGHNRLHAFVHVSARECVSVTRANATGNGTYLEQLCTPPYDAS